MVASYVEIIVGIRLSDRQACQILLGFSDEEYTDENTKYKFVFSNFNIAANYVIDFQELWECDIKIFTVTCCSDTTDVVVGISLRKLYRLKMRCENCSEYTLCNKCFTTTEQGNIDYKKTYNFGICPAENVCYHCHSHNDDESRKETNGTCRTCKRELTPYEPEFFGEMINKILEIDISPNIYYHWNDCGSCT
jgi:hypothetical protein